MADDKPAQSNRNPDRITPVMRANIDKTLARALTTLEAKTEPNHTAVIVVDVQNDFCAEGGMLDTEGFDLTRIQTMVPRLVGLIDKAREAADEA